jgi:hypothetical protein
LGGGGRKAEGSSRAPNTLAPALVLICNSAASELRKGEPRVALGVERLGNPGICCNKWRFKSCVFRQ